MINHNAGLCVVCRMAWADHGLGGNCLMAPHWVQHKTASKKRVQKDKRRGKQQKQRKKKT